MRLHRRVELPEGVRLDEHDVQGRGRDFHTRHHEAAISGMRYIVTVPKIAFGLNDVRPEQLTIRIHPVHHVVVLPRQASQRVSRGCLADGIGPAGIDLWVHIAPDQLSRSIELGKEWPREAGSRAPAVARMPPSGVARTA